MLVVSAHILFSRHRPYHSLDFLSGSQQLAAQDLFFCRKVYAQALFRVYCGNKFISARRQEMFLTVCLVSHYPENKPKAKQNNGMKGILFHLAPRRIESQPKRFNLQAFFYPPFLPSPLMMACLCFQHGFSRHPHLAMA